MIELRHVTKFYPAKYGKRYVLRDVSLVIPDRANIAVLGPNGAGKSTFLRLIGGAEAANRGTIVTDAEISWPLGLSSGFQGSLTGRQNVLFVCRINGLSPLQVREVVRHVTEFAELGGYGPFQTPEEVPMVVLLPSFLTSELKTAFQIGFLLFVPFLIIDLVVASVLMSMGMMMLSPMLVSLPFKLMLFVLIDGWTLVASTLVNSFVV